MEVFVHIYFGISKIIYSSISRRNKLFIFLEVVGCSIQLLIYILLATYLKRSIKCVVEMAFQPEIRQIMGEAIYSLIWGFLFLALALVSRILVKSDSMDTKHESGISVGIIDFSWLFIMAAAYSGIIFSRYLPILDEPIKKGMHIEYYKMYFDELMYFMGKCIDFGIILGTILAACMAILWGKDVWRKEEITKEESIRKEDYKRTTSAAIKMVTAYFLTCIASFHWIIIPIYSRLTILKTLINC